MSFRSECFELGRDGGGSFGQSCLRFEKGVKREDEGCLYYKKTSADMYTMGYVKAVIAVIGLRYCDTSG